MTPTPHATAFERPLVLRPYPQSPSVWDGEMKCELGLFDTCMTAKFWAESRGGEDDLCVPPLQSSQPSRCDGLWESTCFELFLKPTGADSYWEVNVSPRGDWAVYAFDDYRAGMRNEVGVKGLSSFTTSARGGQEMAARLDVEFSLELGGVPSLAAAIQGRELKVGVTSVLATRLGKGYWALVHAGTKPDFHLSDSFIHSFTTEQPK